MRLGIVVDQRYWRSPDGAVWTRMPPDYRFFRRHLEIFERISVIARVAPVAEPPDGAIRADGPGMQFKSIGHYTGPWNFLRHASRLLPALRRAAGACDALLLRVPSNLAHSFTPNGPFAVEVLGDPAELYSPGACRAAMRAFYRQWFVIRLRQQCQQAVAAAYVSKELSCRYPGPSTHLLLDADLGEEAFASSPRRTSGSRQVEIATVGGFDHPVKGHDVLLRAVSLLRLSGIDARLTIVGDGGLRDELRRLAESLRVPTTFAGQVGGASRVRQTIRNADLFVLASRSEGKPRAMLEAMALGIPAIGTRVGGIPELLPSKQLTERDDPDALFRVIRATLDNPVRYWEQSAHGMEVAAAYRRDKEHSQRRAFLDELRAACSKTSSSPRRLRYAA